MSSDSEKTGETSAKVRNPVDVDLGFQALNDEGADQHRCQSAQSPSHDIETSVEGC